MDRFNVCHTWFDGQGSLVGLTLFMAVMLLVTLGAALFFMALAGKLIYASVADKELTPAALAVLSFLGGIGCLSIVIMMWESTACYFAAW